MINNSTFVNRMIRPYLRDWMIPYLPNLGGKTKEVVENLNAFTNKVCIDFGNSYSDKFRSY